MAGLLVTYDLVGTDAESESYKNLIAAIKAYPDWGHVQDSVWVVSTSDEPKTVRDALKQHMDTSDRIFVAALEGTAAWTNPRCKSETLKRIL